MKGFREFVDEPLSIDDWGRDSENTNAITEAGLARVVQKIKTEDNDFVVITAYRGEFDKKENIKRNRELRAWFDRQKMGVYQLVGHWRECSIESVEYEDCPTDKLVDVVERSYLAIRPDDMHVNDFLGKIKYFTRIWNQDASVARIKELWEDEIRLVTRSGKTVDIGKRVELNAIAQAYSQHVKKLEVPFTFEGLEVPATNLGRQLAQLMNFNYPVGDWKDLRGWSDIQVLG